MKKYLIVHELNPELTQFYINGHRTSHEGEFKKHFKSMKDAGANECYCWVWRNNSILYVEYDGPIEDFFEKLGKDSEMQKWIGAMGIAQLDPPQGESIIALKVYDVNEQLQGFLTNF